MNNVIILDELRKRQLARERQRREAEVDQLGINFVQASETVANALRRYRQRGEPPSTTEQVVGLANLASLRRKAERLAQAERELKDWLTANGLQLPAEAKIEIIDADAQR